MLSIKEGKKGLVKAIFGKGVKHTMKHPSQRLA